jgi:hypothetical protein
MPKLSLAEPALIQAVNFVPPFAEPPGPGVNLTSPKAAIRRCLNAA